MSVNLALIKEIAKLTYENAEQWCYNVYAAMCLANLGRHLQPSPAPVVAQWLGQRVTTGTASRQQVGAPSAFGKMWKPHTDNTEAGPSGFARTSAAATTIRFAGPSLVEPSFAPPYAANEQFQQASRAPTSEGSLTGVAGNAGEEGGEESGVGREKAAVLSSADPQPGKLSAGALSAAQMERNIDQYRLDCASLLRAKTLHAAAAVPLPPSELGSDEWWENEMKAKSYMILCMTDELQERFRDYGTCQEIFEEVESWSVQRARRMAPKLLEELRVMQMGFSESPTTYFNRIKRLSLALIKSGTTVAEFTCIELAIAGAAHPRFAALLTLFSGPDFVEGMITFAEVQYRYEAIDTSNQRLPTTHPFYPPWIASTFALTPPPSLPVMAATDPPRGSGVPQCIHCPRPGHPSEKCWEKFPALRPKNLGGRSWGKKKPPAKKDGSQAAAIAALQAAVASLTKK